MKMANLAAKLNTDQSNLAKRLGGNPTLSKLEEIASALDVSVRDLFPDAGPSLKEGVLRVGDRHFALVPIEIPDTAFVYSISRFYSKVNSFVLDCLGNKEITQSFCGLYGGVCPFSLVYDGMNQRFILSFCHSGHECYTWSYDPKGENVLRLCYSDKLVADYIARSIINDIEEHGHD